MKHGWIAWICPFLLAAAELPPPALTEAPAAGPKPFTSSHYELLQEYSPFVKSLESAKETEKSPDLVVVGYGRMKGEDHVILQMKDNSEKREKIGPRFGSKDFPYRLLSVTNVGDRKAFVAFLEGRNKKKFPIRYATETAAPPSGVIGGGAGQPPPQTGGGNANSGASMGRSMVPASPGVTNPDDPASQTQKLISNLEASIANPATPAFVREAQIKNLEAAKKKLGALQVPTDLTTPEVAPPPAP